MCKGIKVANIEELDSTLRCPPFLVRRFCRDAELQTRWNQPNW
jgi:hypothetical protein